MHDRGNQNQQFPVHYPTDRYQNGSEPSNNHLSYTVSGSPPAQRRAPTPQRQGSLPEPRRSEQPVALHQLHSPSPHPPAAPRCTPDDMEPQNISFIGNAEDDALRQGIDRLNISSGTRTYRIPSPTRPSLARNSFHKPEDTNEKGFYISFDNEQPKRPKPPLRAKKGSPRKDQSDSTSPDRSPENTWNDRVERNERLRPEEEPFVVHRVSRDMARPDDLEREAPRDRPQRAPAPEPAALVIGDLNVDTVRLSFIYS